MNAIQTALNAAQPYPDWDTSKNPWESEGGDWYRTNRAVFHETLRDGMTVACVAVEQYEVLGQTAPPPVLDVHVSDRGAKESVTWQEAMQMGAALMSASGLLQSLLVEAGEITE